MIFYKSEEEIENQKKINKEELEKRKVYYEQRKNESLEVLQKINEQIQEETEYEKINSLIIDLYQRKEGIENLRSEKKKISELLDIIYNLEADIKNYTKPEYKEKVNKFNELYKNVKPEEKIEEKEQIEQTAIENIKQGEEDAKKGIEILEETAVEENKQVEFEEDTELKQETDIKDIKEPEEVENVLLISEIKNKVVLPYTFFELDKILNTPDSDYKNREEVIEEEYSIPLSEYKNFYSSRFKEAYNLIKKKEKRGTFEALDIGFEMASNRKLHPAIIRACERLDQLDIYLDCLEDNKLDEYPYFKVKFESYPTKPI